MQKIKRVLFFFIIAFIFVSFTSCNSKELSLPQSTQSIILQSYKTPTFISTQESIPTKPKPTLPPLPTATPYQYSIQSGDNLSSIALRFGVTLDQIYLANPNISPNSLSIGQIIVIPDAKNENSSTNSFTSEALSLDLSTPLCYSTVTNSTWCFIKITNNTSSVAENISINFYIFDQNNNLITNQITTPPSNILPPQKTTIASYYFKNIPVVTHISATLLTAIPSQNNEQRYISATFNQTQFTISENKKTVHIQGTLQLQSIPTSYSWLIAIAYDKDKNPVGFKQWESTDLVQQYHIDFYLYSAGGTIETIEYLTEVR